MGRATACPGTMRKRARRGQDGKGRSVVAHLKRGMKLIFAGLFVLLVAALLLVARLGYGPVAIDGLAPWMEQRIAARIPGATATLHDPVLAWTGGRPGFELRIRALDLSLDGDADLRSSRLRIAIDLRGRPREIEIGRLEGEVTRLAAASGPGVTDLDLAARRLPAPLNGALDRLVRAFPHQMTIAEVHLALVDTESHVLAELRKARFEARRAAHGLTLEASADLAATGGKVASITLSADLRRKGAKSVELTLADARLSRLGDAVPAMPWLGGIALPLDVAIAGEADAGGRLTHARLHITAGAGNLRLAPYYPEPVTIDGGRVDLSYGGDPPIITVDALSVAFAGTGLELAGGIGLGPAGLASLELEGGFGPLQVRDLVRYWPRGLGEGGRSWIDDNLQSGVIDGARVALDLPALAQEGAAFPADALRLDFRFSGLLGHYLRPMPPLRAASGSGRLSAADLVLRFDEGRIAGMPIAGSTVRLTGFDESGTDTGIIDLRMLGPLPDILRLIDSPPLGYATAFGIAPDMIAGSAAVTARITLPLLKDARLDDVDLDLEAMVDDLAIPDVLAGHALDAGHLQMRVDRHGLAARGRARFADIPLRLVWQERFDAGTEPSSRYEIAADLTADDLATFGLGVADYFTGVAAVDLRLNGNGARIAGGALSLDLSRARLELAALDWRKASGAPATFHAALDFTDPDRIIVRKAAFVAGLDRIAGGLSFDSARGVLAAADFAQVRLGATEGAFRYQREDAGSVRIAFSGPRFDARGMLSGLDLGTLGQGGDTAPLSLRFHADRVLALADELFEDVAIEAERDRDRWQRLTMRAHLAEDGAIALDLGPEAEEGARAFRLEAGDAGRAFRALGIFDQAEGGRLAVEAQLLGAGPDLRVEGRARLEKVRVVRSKAFRVAGDPEAMSRLDAYIGKSGLHFDSMELPFRVADGVIDIDNAVASGAKLGLTMEGQIDDRFDQVNVNGLIVPAYWLNSALGKLPLIGGIFSGGKGGGLFAFAYRIKGATDDPTIEVSAMSGILPGIMRQPFTGSKGKLDKLPESEEKAAPEPPPGG